LGIRQADGSYVAKNGSAFFLDAAERLLGVTADHVIAEWRRDRSMMKSIAFLADKVWPAGLWRIG
jgi:hypothetical protein